MQIRTHADFIGKALIVVLFGTGAAQKALALASLLYHWTEVEGALRWNYLAAHCAALAFIALTLALTIIRPPPVKRSEGVEPVVTAWIGTFLAGFMGILPPAGLGPTWTLIAIGLSTAGGALSFYVLSYLGCSFSITPQVRQLVTTGPYAIVRHPLYLAEELMAIGMIMLVISPAAVAIGLLHAVAQLRRMTNEERILRAQFADYDQYAARTAKIIPRVY